MTQADRVLAALAEHGLLLKQDKSVSSVVGILTGESLRTSWWSHPKARLIFAVLSQLSDHPDVLSAKLLYHKDTLIHRSLWPSVLAVAQAHEPWQLSGLPDAARALLDRLEQGEGPIRTSGASVKALEVRLLARVQAVHTEAGHHAMVVESWQTWSARVGCDAAHSLIDARTNLDRAATSLGAPLTALPWPRRSVAI